MKGEVSLSNVIKYYTESKEGRNKLPSKNADIFIDTIKMIKRNHFYTIDIDSGTLPQNSRHLRGKNGRFLIVPFWVSRSGVTFRILASSFDEAMIGYRKVISFTYFNLNGNLKEISFDELPMWVGSVYVSELYTQAFDGGIDVSRDSIDREADYAAPIINRNERLALNDGSLDSALKNRLIKKSRYCIADMLGDMAHLFFSSFLYITPYRLKEMKRTYLKYKHQRGKNPIEDIIVDMNDVEDLLFDDTFIEKIKEVIKNKLRSPDLKCTYQITRTMMIIGRYLGSLENIARLLWGLDPKAPIILKWAELFGENYGFTLAYEVE